MMPRELKKLIILVIIVLICYSIAGYGIATLCLVYKVSGILGALLVGVVMIITYIVFCLVDKLHNIYYDEQKRNERGR